MSGVFTKENFKRLETWERAELMRIQMSPSYGSRSSYLPEDCGECGVCGDACLGAGWCRRCHERYEFLMNKLTATYTWYTCPTCKREHSIGFICEAHAR